MPRWRIGMVQMIPELAQVEKNRKRLLELTSKFQPGTLDLLCLPEMVLTGYTFSSATAIKPYLELPEKGPTALCCRELAKHLRCHVIAGYPENREDEKSVENGVGYNSAIICGPDGEFCGSYRKTNLFETDKPWAIPGSGFTVFNLEEPLSRFSLGICMDLNPFPDAVWTSLDDGPYELAEFILQNDVPLLIILCAWLDSKGDPEEEWDWQTVNYWITRLHPLWRKGCDKSNKEKIVVICNRAGSEGDTLFAGTSVILRLSHLESPEIIGILPRTKEVAQVWEVKV